MTIMENATWYTSCKDFGNGKGLSIHMRTSHIGAKQWSTIAGIAVQIDNDTFEIEKEGSYLINGVNNPLLPITFTG